MTGDMPKSRNARPITFALRAQVREQIQEMLKDDNLEKYFSDYVNPLTLVKGIRICIDTRRVNARMVLDRVKVDPMKELLQKFHGSKYITTIDLISAFLQVPLHRSSRKWTRFQFGNQVYQYEEILYGQCQKLTLENLQYL